MARIRKFDEVGPEVIEIGGVARGFCKCGLTKNYPFCDGSHQNTYGEEDGKVYKYDDDGNRKEV